MRGCPSRRVLLATAALAILPVSGTLAAEPLAIDVHPACFSDFRNFEGKMFASYHAFISPRDRTTADGASVATFAEALRNDRTNMFGGSTPESEHDAFDDYFTGDPRELAVLDELVLIADCAPADSRTPHGVRLIQRLAEGETMRLSVRLFHLQNGKTGVLLRAPR